MCKSQEEWRGVEGRPKDSKGSIPLKRRRVNTKNGGTSAGALYIFEGGLREKVSK